MKNWLFVGALLFAGAAIAADLPPQGMSMANVAKQFGQPVQKTGPVGKPPITRWIYKDFTVVFEYKHVVHSMTVEKGAPADAAPAAPAPVQKGKGEAAISVDVK